MCCWFSLMLTFERLFLNATLLFQFWQYCNRNCPVINTVTISMFLLFLFADLKNVPGSLLPPSPPPLSSPSIEGEYVPAEGDLLSYKVCSIPPKHEKVQAVEVSITQPKPGTPHETWAGTVVSSWSPAAPPRSPGGGGGGGRRWGGGGGGMMRSRNRKKMTRGGGGGGGRMMRRRNRNRKEDDWVFEWGVVFVFVFSGYNIITFRGVIVYNWKEKYRREELLGGGRKETRRGHTNTNWGCAESRLCIYEGLARLRLTP